MEGKNMLLGRETAKGHLIRAVTKGDFGTFPEGTIVEESLFQPKLKLREGEVPVILGEQRLFTTIPSDSFKWDIPEQ